VNRGTIDLYKVYSFNRVSTYKPSSFSFYPQLPSETIGRVIDEKHGSRVTAATSDLNDVSIYLSSSGLFPVVFSATLFKVKSFFTSTRLHIRKLNIKELL